MVTDKQIQKALRDAAARKSSIELKDPGERGAGRLAIVIRPMATRVAAEWYAVFYRAGKRATAKLGSYPTMPVAEARRVFLSDYAPAISAGQSPAVAKRQKASAGTVDELFTAYVDHLERSGKRVAAAVGKYLDAAVATIGSGRPAASIAPDDIVPHLAAIHARGSRVHANTVRSYISAAFNFGLRSEHDFTRANVDTRWGLKVNPVAAIPADANARRPADRFLSADEFRHVWNWTEGYTQKSLIAYAVLLKLALGQRTEEVLRISSAGYDRGRQMLSWDETKNGLAHSIPLPKQAVAILDRLTPNSHGLFFPRQTDQSLPAVYGGFIIVIYKFLKTNPGFPPFNARDLRRTWKTLAGEAGISKEMRDKLQNHAQRGDVSSRHYDRYDYLVEKRAAMEKWSAYLGLVIEGKVDEIGARTDNVVQIGKEAAA